MIQLLDDGHHIVCGVRDLPRFNQDFDLRKGSIEVIHTDFLIPETLENIPRDIEAAYYLIHSMSTTTGDLEKM